MRIFVTGTTGFLGAHIANVCIDKGHEVLCLKRNFSRSLFRPEIEKKLKWVNSDIQGWKSDVFTFQPDILIHAAWSGVSSLDRNDREIQRRNIELAAVLLKIYPYKQVIMLGSQDEYGRLDSLVDEKHGLYPVTEYGKAKIECSVLLMDYCEKNNIDWQWIRVFSIFGELQNENWLIPSIIRKCISGDTEMNATPAEQIYSYLYSLDFAEAIESMLGVRHKSGVYNLSSNQPILLKDIFLKIKKITASSIRFNFGALPYRNGQSMYIMSDSQKFIDAFGPFQRTGFEIGLLRTIEYIKGKR